MLTTNRSTIYRQRLEIGTYLRRIDFGCIFTFFKNVSEMSADE